MIQSIFVYKNKEYLFDISLFQKYAKSSLVAFEKSMESEVYYYNFISEYDNYTDISENCIKEFISYCQNQEIKLTDSNVFPLHFLSEKYDVEALTEETQKYIKTNGQSIIDEILKIGNDDIIFNNYIEDFISDHISTYLNDDRLLSLPIPSVHRILLKFSKQINFEEENDEEFSIIEFLFKYIEKNGKQCSFLLTLFKFGEKSCEYINEKLSENFDSVDFECIKPIIFRSFHFMNQKQKEKEMEIRKEYLNQQRSSIESIRSNCVSLFNELLNIDFLKQTLLSDKESPDKKFSPSLVQYGLLYSIRSIFNNSFVPAEQILSEIQNFSSNETISNKPSKFDLLNLLMTENLFTKNQSVLIGKKDYCQIVSLVATIKEKQTKKSFIDLFKLIENKPSLIGFVFDIFPNFVFKGTKFDIVVFWIDLITIFIRNKISFSLTIDRNKFDFNFDSIIGCKIDLIMNEKNSFSLSQGSKIHYSNNNGSFSLNFNDDMLAFYLLLELPTRQMKTVLPMSDDEIFNYYLKEATKRKINNDNPSTKMVLSIKNLFKNRKCSIISMIWNLVFSLSELEISEVSSLINPIESQLLIAAYKMFKSDDHTVIIEWSKWAESIDKYDEIITKCIIKSDTSYSDLSSENIQSLISSIGNAVKHLRKMPEKSHKFINLDDIIQKCEQEYIELMVANDEQVKYMKDLKELIKFLKDQDIKDEIHKKMRNQIVEEIEGIKILKEEYYFNSEKIIEQFINDSEARKEENEIESISWPNHDIISSPNQTNNKKPVISLFDSLIFYSHVKSLLKEIKKTNNIMETLTKLNNFQGIINSIKIFLASLIQNKTDSNLTIDINDVKSARYALDANLIMKLYNIDDMFITNPKYLCDFINGFEKREQCNEDDIHWIDGVIRETPHDFLIQIPKFKANSLVSMIINKAGSNSFVAGPLLADIKDLNISLLKGQESLMFNEFESFTDAAKLIGQIFYNSLISQDEIPPQEYDDLKYILYGPLNISGVKLKIIEKLKILFSIAESLDNWTNNGLLFNDISFLSMDWKKLLVDETLLNNYPSFLFWIYENQECTKQIRSVFHDFVPNPKKIPLWLLYLRVISSKQCISFDSSTKTSISLIIKNVLKSKIIEYLDESSKQSNQINFDWLNLLIRNTPKKKKNKNIIIFHDFMNNLSVDNLDNQYNEVLSLKYQNVKDSISELASLILSNKSIDLFQKNCSDMNSIANFLCYPAKHLQNKIGQALKDYKKEALFKYNFDLIDLSKINDNPIIPLVFPDQVDKKVLATPLFYLSFDNEILCTMDSLNFQVDPIFPSLLSDEPITINLSSFIDEKIYLSIDCPDYSKIISTKEKVMNKELIQLFIKAPNITGKEKQTVNIKGNLKMKIKGMNEKAFPFDIALQLLPMKVNMKCIQFPLSKLKSKHFKLCCDRVTSEDTIDFEITNYFIPELFKVNVELEPLINNKADKPIIKINEKTKMFSITVPHVDEPTRSHFNIIVKLCKNLEITIKCDFVIQPTVVIFEMYDICTKEFCSENCYIVSIEPYQPQDLYFRIISLHRVKQNIRIEGSFPNYIKIDGSSLTTVVNENSISKDDVEIDSVFSFTIKIVSLPHEVIKDNTKYNIKLYMAGITKTIEFKFIDSRNENNDINDIEYMTTFPCYSYSYNDEKWIKIRTKEDIQELKNPKYPFVITTPFDIYTNIKDFIVIDYHREGVDYVFVSNPTKMHVSYIQITSEKEEVKTSSSAKADKKTTSIKKYYVIPQTTSTIFYSIIGYIEEDKNNWFPAFDEYPKINMENYSTLPYIDDKQISENAKARIQEIKNSYQSQNDSKLTSSLIFVNLLTKKNVVLQMKSIIEKLPDCFHSKFEKILTDTQPFLYGSMSNEILSIISYNLIITFIPILQQRYIELDSHQYCLQMTISNAFIYKQKSEAFDEFKCFNNDKVNEIRDSIFEFFSEKELERHQINVESLPDKSKQIDCVLINENNHSKASSKNKKVKKLIFEKDFNIRLIYENLAETVLSLPPIDVSTPDSLLSYMKFFSSCSQGALVLPAFILNHIITDNDHQQSQQYFTLLFNLYKELTKDSLENKTVLSNLINNFINLFHILVTRLIMSGIKCNKFESIKNLNECKYEYQNLISIPKNETPDLPKIDWNKNQ